MLRLCDGDAWCEADRIISVICVKKKKKEGAGGSFHPCTRGSKKFKPPLPENAARMKAHIWASLDVRVDRWQQAGPPRHYSHCRYGCSRLEKSSCVLCLEGKRLVIIAVIMPESNSPRAAGAELQLRVGGGEVLK